LASEYGVHPIQVSKWKKELVDGAKSVFDGKKGSSKEEPIGRKELERKIEQLTVELDFLKKRSGS
jgi:transposase